MCLEVERMRKINLMEKEWPERQRENQGCRSSGAQKPSEGKASGVCELQSDSHLVEGCPFTCGHL